MERLELAGFYIGPDQRLRIWRVVEQVGKTDLRSPEKLKYLLAPVIAKGEADQERFYELFDRYWEEINQPWEMPEEPEEPDWKKAQWVRWVILGVILAGLLGGAYFLYDHLSSPYPEVKFVPEKGGDTKIHFGDTVRFINKSQNIDTTRVLWQILDGVNEEIESEIDSNYHLEYVFDNVDKGHHKRIRLIGHDIQNRRKDTARYAVSVYCNRLPHVEAIKIPESVKVGEPAEFRVLMADDENVSLEWDFGENGGKEGVEVVTEFQQSGPNEVRLTARRDGEKGFCEQVVSRIISVEDEDKGKAYIVAKTLNLDSVSPIVNLSWGTYILMGLLGVVMIVFWVRWASRKPPPGEGEGGMDLEAARVKYEAADKGPYFIPLRPQQHNIRVVPELYRLGDVMRLRQEGLRREVDVPVSVTKTIDGGGFPRLFTKTDTVPTEYLFLLDEQSQVSHQRRLFEFVVDFLLHKEVIGEVFYFNTHLHRFWNNQHPNGLSAEQLQRMFPTHRLVVVGDAHELIDPHPVKGDRPALRAEALELFLQWKHRVLLTPVPVVSWSYKEGTLHEIFAVFPMDSDGLEEASKFIEQGVEDDERPAYASWCERLSEHRKDPDIDRRWRSPGAHRAYFEDHPALYQWLCALTVYPEPDWNMTLAIGRALSPVGVALHYDNLLILSRVPFLKEGALSSRTLRELKEDLDPEVERLAREAVRMELEAVRSLVRNSYVNQEHRINLAIQNFVLVPQSMEHQQSIRELLALNLLTKDQEKVLDRGISREYSGQKGLQKMMQKSMVEEEGTGNVRDFLQENKPDPEPRKKPFFTRDFYIAGLATLLYLILFLFGWNYGGTEALSNLLGQDSNATTNCREELVLGGFFKKECVADSAVLLNNRAVGIFQNMAKGATPSTHPLLREANQLKVIEVDSLFGMALEMRPNYDLAKLNRLKLNFNLGVQEYHAYLADSSDTNGLRRAAGYFESVEQDDSLAMDAMHGRGLTEYFIEETVGTIPKVSRTSYILYERILRRDSSYFDTLSTYPHLQALLLRDDARVKKQVEIRVVDKESGRSLPGARVDGRMQGRLGGIEVDMFPGERKTFKITSPGYRDLEQEITATRGVDVVTIEMEKEPAPTDYETVADDRQSTRSRIYFDRDRASIREEARNVLDQVAKELASGDVRLEITGLPEPDVTVAYARRIAERRTNAIRDYLVKRGVSPEQMMVKVGAAPLEYSTDMGEREKLNYIRVDLDIVYPEQGSPQQRPPEETPDLSSVLKEIEANMVTVYEGTFRMGCDEQRDVIATEDEMPVHEVFISTFQISKYEVTQEQWDALMDYNPSKLDKDCRKCPVDNVSWNDTKEFIKKLNSVSGKNYRLPTEAEWEYAARGGNQSKGFRYAGSNNVDEVGWYNKNARGKPQPVGLKQPNELGLYDMSGNVWEWCNDWTGPYPENYSQGIIRNPTGASGPGGKVIRGGAFGLKAEELRSCNRDGHGQDSRHVYNGFRLARSTR